MIDFDGKRITGWWFQLFLNFHPKILANGLKPPVSFLVSFLGSKIKEIVGDH